MTVEATHRRSALVSLDRAEEAIHDGDDAKAREALERALGHLDHE